MTAERWRQVKEILRAAWELDGRERAAYLDQALAGDTELRAQVEALLASDESGGEFLAVPMEDIALGADGGVAGRQVKRRTRNILLDQFRQKTFESHGGIRRVGIAHRRTGIAERPVRGGGGPKRATAPTVKA